MAFSGTFFGEDDSYMTYELEGMNTPGHYQEAYSVSGDGQHVYTGVDVAKLIRVFAGEAVPSGTPVLFEGADGALLETTYGELNALAYSSYDETGQPLVRGLPVLLYFGVDGTPNVNGAMGIVFGQRDATDDNASRQVVGLKRICVGDDVNYLQHVWAPYNDFDAICGGKANGEWGYTNLTVRIYQGGTDSANKGVLVREKVFGLDEIETRANADRANIHHGCLSAYLYEDRTEPTSGKYTDYYEGYDLYELLKAADKRVKVTVRK